MFARRVRFAAAALTLAALAGAAGSGDSQRPRGCSREHPQFGVLRLQQAVAVTINRIGQVPFTLGSGGAICAEDVILTPRGAGGWVDAQVGPPLPLRPESRLVIPSRRNVIREWLRWAGFRLRAFDPVSLGTAGTLMGDRSPGFALRGLRSGTAIIGADHRSIAIPLYAGDIPQTVELWAPGAETPLTAEMPARQGENSLVVVRFDNLRLRADRRPWLIVIAGDRSIRGGFIVAPGEPDREARSILGGEPASQREAALTHACLDPRGNAFEAFQRLSDPEDRRLVLQWQDPSDQIGCSASLDNSPQQAPPQ